MKEKIAKQKWGGEGYLGRLSACRHFLIAQPKLLTSLQATPMLTRLKDTDQIVGLRCTSYPSPRAFAAGAHIHAWRSSRTTPPPPPA